LDDAVAFCRRALALKPDFAEAHNNLGNALKDQGKLAEAVAGYRRAAELKPDFAEACSNLGNALREQGNLHEAVVCYRRALEINPNFAAAHNNLGNALREQGRLDDAVAFCRRAVELKPDFAEAHNNLGNALREQGKLDDAVARYRQALKLKPGVAEAHNNLGIALQDQGKLDQAIACYHRALALEPDYADAHFNRSLVQLLAGEFPNGWPEYEWRWQTKEFTPRHFPQPLWNGASLAGKTILLHAEQGLGDTIHFIRYAPIVKQHGGTVIVECQKPLLGLLDSFFGGVDRFFGLDLGGVDRLIGRGSGLPAFDTHAPLLSLPGILGTTMETIPAKIPYLAAKPALLEQWRTRLLTIEGFKIGISWQGNPTYRGDRFRSIPLRWFAPLAEIPGVRLISLQKGAGTEQLAEIGNLFPVTDLAGELDEQSGPFMDTAAVMKNLDLVIASDSAVAHLAGALGVPVWVALPLAPDWRWLLDRSDSPWYPTMQLFRQGQQGDWQGVFEEIKKALCEPNR
jgi:Flp pilus assembly protein TadD